MNDRHQIAPYPIRMSAELRAQLEDAAKVGSRSLHAEIIARLEDSVSTSSDPEELAFNEGFAVASLKIEVAQLREQLHAERMRKFEDRVSADGIGRMLESLPVELVSQYGLHLYRSELSRVHSDAETARQEFQARYDELQALLTSGSPPGPRADVKRSVSELQTRVQELEEQARLLEQAISGIHTYREVNGLPEIRQVQRLYAG